MPYYRAKKPNSVSFNKMYISFGPGKTFSGIVGDKSIRGGAVLYCVVNFFRFRDQSRLRGPSVCVCVCVWQSHRAQYTRNCEACSLAILPSLSPTLASLSFPTFLVVDSKMK